MRELIDIRLSEEWAAKEFGPALGKPLPHAPTTGNVEADRETDRLFPPLVRRIVLDARDAKLKVVKDRICEAKRRSPERFIHGSIDVQRRYTTKELENAESFHLFLIAVFEPAGIDGGTEYDDSRACPKCGAGRRQVSPLRLHLDRVPKRADIARTIARSEWIVSERLASLMREARLSGYELKPVEHTGRRPARGQWYQLVVQGRAGHTVPPTRFAIHYLRDDVNGEFVCEQHGLSGLNVVSEIYIDHAFVDQADVLTTSNRVGLWGGVLSPHPILLISPRFYRLLHANGIKGYRVEIAHVV